MPLARLQGHAVVRAAPCRWVPTPLPLKRTLSLGGGRRHHHVERGADGVGRAVVPVGHLQGAEVDVVVARRRAVDLDRAKGPVGHLHAKVRVVPRSAVLFR